MYQEDPVDSTMDKTEGQAPPSPPKNVGSRAQAESLRCAYCGNTFLKSQTPVMPFCSRRCQQLDLGMWLTESYGLPYEGESTQDRHAESDADDSDE